MKIIHATIPAAASLSRPLQVSSNKLRALIMPNLWTAAPITFQASLDGQNWRNVFNMLGTEISVSGSQGQYIVIDSSFPGLWDSSQEGNILAPMLRLRSGTSVLPVVQAQESIVLLVVE